MNRTFLPKTMDEFRDIMAAHPGAVLFAGGTDLFVRLRALNRKPDVLVGLADLGELQRVEENRGSLFIGASVTHARLLSEGLIQDKFPVLVHALRSLGSPPVRNMGTLGGNICTASPAGDTLPPLYVLDAEMELRRYDECRRVPIRQFIQGPGKTAIRDGELLYGIWLKTGDSWRINHFEKVGQRKALAISIVSVAALVDTTDEGIIKKIRLAWGSVGPTIVTSGEVESALTGLPLNLETLSQVKPLAEAAVLPIDDVRASAAYRRALAARLILRLAGYGADGATGKWYR
jgi:xanthine dehydrogenase FAD-binding subunit